MDTNAVRPDLTDDPYALSHLMEFDHVIRVHADGTVTDGPSAYLELAWDAAGPTLSAPAGWELLAGYSGQYGYSGPIMHSSEQLTGGLARDILATPGLYVALVAEVLPEECQHGPGDGHEPECDPDQEPAGWAVTYLAG